MQTDEFRALVDHDEHHWWYRGRRRVLHAALGRLELPDRARVLDAGCGSGRTMDDLMAYGDVRGFDLNPDGVAHALGRGHTDVRVARIEEIPFADESFDLVTCLDVLEHIPDDRGGMTELLRVTRPGGHLVVTVPAYKFLWSSHDEANEHYRRYRRRQLRRAGEEAGWTPERSSYFNTLLLPPAAAVRLAQRVLGSERRNRSDLQFTPRAMDTALSWPMRLEAALIGRGATLPVGMSLLMTFRRPVEHSAPTGARRTPQLAGAGVKNL
jgi:SAM-dependent methyltransferase